MVSDLVGLLPSPHQGTTDFPDGDDGQEQRRDREHDGNGIAGQHVAHGRVLCVEQCQVRSRERSRQNSLKPQLARSRHAEIPCVDTYSKARVICSVVASRRLEVHKIEPRAFNRDS